MDIYMTVLFIGIIKYYNEIRKKPLKNVEKQEKYQLVNESHDKIEEDLSIKKKKNLIKPF